jgi:uncharacterized membrane protein YebE (DUF533 family)
MFNAEKMLGKMLTGALGSGSRSRGIGSSLVSELTSGVGLMTVIGLGVGAYEIMKGQDKTPSGSPQMPPPLSPTGASIPPPPPSSASPPQTAPSPPQIPTPPPQQNVIAGTGETPCNQLSGPKLAMQMIQAMVAAAAADGRIDTEEEARILEKLQEQGLSREEKQVLLQELHNPTPIDEFTAGIEDPATAQTMYSVAVMAITIDTDAERQWLDRLAKTLGITPAMQRFLEEMPE